VLLTLALPTPAEKGDYIKQDDVVVVIETDKVSVDVRAPQAGYLEEMLANAGELLHASPWPFPD
jgi:2-oxoglutarate dehydrogenase E2 component (dihydrolipoamide succinyltransferase)